MTTREDSQGGGSLVGILLVLVVLGGLAAVAVAALPGDEAGTPGRLQGLVPGDPVGGGAQPGRPASPVAGASVASCLTTVRTVEAAAAARQAAQGAFPATVAELVAAGLLSEAPALRGYDVRMEAAGGQPTGKVLVNDLPADKGCAGTPRPIP